MKRLVKFIVFDLKKGIPEVFRTYCQTAIDSTSDNAPRDEKQASTTATFKVGDVTVHLVQGEFTKLSAQDIKQAHPSYSEPHLILTHIQNVSSQNWLVTLLVN